MECHPLTKVLVANGDPSARAEATGALHAAGHDVVEAGNGADALRAIYRQRPDLAILAIELAVFDGWQVLGRIREVSEMPVILVGASGLDHLAVRGLEAGADDYIDETCSTAELAARVEALYRRARCTSAQAAAAVLGTAQLEIDLGARTVRCAVADLAVTPLEFRLLATFLRHPDQTLSAEQLLQQAWDDETFVGAERVKFAVSRLRKKLTAHGSTDPITAVRGFGYRFHPLAA